MRSFIVGVMVGAILSTATVFSFDDYSKQWSDPLSQQYQVRKQLRETQKMQRQMQELQSQSPC